MTNEGERLFLFTYQKETFLRPTSKASKHYVTLQICTHSVICLSLPNRNTENVTRTTVTRKEVDCFKAECWKEKHCLLLLNCKVAAVTTLPTPPTTIKFDSISEFSSRKT